VRRERIHFDGPLGRKRAPIQQAAGECREIGASLADRLGFDEYEYEGPYCLKITMSATEFGQMLSRSGVAIPYWFIATSEVIAGLRDLLGTAREDR
jgi:hypothetical protein